MNRIQLRRLLGASLITLLVLSGCAGGGGGGGGDDRSGIATLASLSVQAGGSERLTNFNRKDYEYSINVLNEVDTVTITATPRDSRAVAQVNGGPSLVVGENTKTVAVTAENGARKTYTITVNRASDDPSHDAELTSLSIDDEPVSGFDHDDFEYELDEVLPAATTNVRVSYTASPGAAVQVYGHMGLVPGSNTITITVTAEDTTTSQEYNVDLYKKGIVINNPASDGATIPTSSFTVSGYYYGDEAPTKISLTFGSSPESQDNIIYDGTPTNNRGEWSVLVDSIEDSDDTRGDKALYAEAKWGSDRGGHFRNIYYQAGTGAGASLSGTISTEETIPAGYSLIVYLLPPGSVEELANPAAMTIIDSCTLPYSYTLRGVSAGTYELYAILVDPSDFEYIDYYAAYENDVVVETTHLTGLDMEMVLNEDVD